MPPRLPEPGGLLFLVIFDVDPQPAGRFFDLPKEVLQIKIKPENIL